MLVVKSVLNWQKMHVDSAAAIKIYNHCNNLTIGQIIRQKYLFKKSWKRIFDAEQFIAMYYKCMYLIVINMIYSSVLFHSGGTSDLIPAQLSIAHWVIK